MRDDTNRSGGNGNPTDTRTGWNRQPANAAYNTRPQDVVAANRPASASFWPSGEAKGPAAEKESSRHDWLATFDPDLLW